MTSDCIVSYLLSDCMQAGFTEVSILSYTAKYASAFYGPFREALDSAPKSSSDYIFFSIVRFNNTMFCSFGNLQVTGFLRTKKATKWIIAIKKKLCERLERLC